MDISILIDSELSLRADHTTRIFSSHLTDTYREIDGGKITSWQSDRYIDIMPDILSGSTDLILSMGATVQLTYRKCISIGMLECRKHISDHYKVRDLSLCDMLYFTCMECHHRHQVFR
jgi:hypothetical protein